MANMFAAQGIRPFLLFALFRPTVDDSEAEIFAKHGQVFFLLVNFLTTTYKNHTKTAVCWGCYRFFLLCFPSFWCLTFGRCWPRHRHSITSQRHLKMPQGQPRVEQKWSQDGHLWYMGNIVWDLGMVDIVYIYIYVFIYSFIYLHMYLYVYIPGPALIIDPMGMKDPFWGQSC